MSSPHDAAPAAIASVVIPAHNEERTIARLLAALCGSSQHPLEIIVVANGCTDGTADVARSYGVTVLEIPEPSKREAMRRGDLAARNFPRIYVDADVEISAGAVRRLADTVNEDGVHASAPRREIPRDRVARPVRWYYDVWEALPQVRAGLFGRGVIALSPLGNDRLRLLPPAMSDDLAISEAFAPAERRVVTDATVVVRPPRTLRDLVRRRVRVATGNAQADATRMRTASARTSPRVLFEVVRLHPTLALKVPVFLGVTLAARMGARRAVRAGDYTTWLRDESSRK